MKHLYKILFMLLAASPIFSQIRIEEREGTVTFISSQYIYVKFDSTAGINNGDTLFIKTEKNLLPVLIVQFTSSKSSAGILLNNAELKVDDKVFALVKVDIKELIEQVKTETQSEIVQPSGEVISKGVYKRNGTKRKSGLSGRFSIQSHSNFSNNNGNTDYQRWRYTLSLNADRISETDLSLSSYIIFHYRADDWKSISSNVWRSLKIYDLAVKYELNETSHLVFGRSRNRNISNVGSIDGMQFEKRFDDFYAGAVIGFRPDFADLNFNSGLFEFGGYIGRTDTLSEGTMDNNLAFMQQTNKFKTDRRFIYLQHSNNILENTYCFASSEIDLYKKILNKESNELILTSVFFSVRYSPVKLFSATVSYDARKNVVYYETFKNFIDSLFENETRQGLNVRTNFRLTNNLFLGLNGGYRFRNGDIKSTRNLGGYVSYSIVPLIESSVSVSYNRLLSSFVESSISGIRISKSIFNNLADISLNYRRSEYELISASFNSFQNIFSADLSLRINREFSLSLSYEGVFEKERTSGRIFIGAASRF